MPSTQKEASSVEGSLAECSRVEGPAQFLTVLEVCAQCYLKETIMHDAYLKVACQSMLAHSSEAKQHHQ